MFKITQIYVTKRNLAEVMTEEGYYKLHKGTVFGNYFFEEVSKMRVADVLDENATIVKIEEE